MKKSLAALLALVAACLCAPAAAGLYRCGNAFQDRPCDAGVEQQMIRPGKGAGKATGAPAAAPPAQPAATAAPATTISAPVQTVAAPATGRPVTGANTVCGNLHEQRNALDGRLRIGGNPNTTEMLQRQRREVEKNLAGAGC